jgi:hypothetical protein
MATFYLKKRDCMPILEVALLNPDGTAYDLTGASGVQLYISLQGSGTLVTKDMAVFGPAANGVVRYQWLPTDWTDTPALTVGQHRMEVEVNTSDGVLTWPNDSYDMLVITPDLGQPAAVPPPGPPVGP